MISPAVEPTRNARALDHSRRIARVVIIGTGALRHTRCFSQAQRLKSLGDFSYCRTADVIIIAARVQQRPETVSRLDDLAQSAAILRQIVEGIAGHDPSGILLIASNPVDVLTYAAWKWSGLALNRVVGSGTSLDTSRFRRRLGERYGVAPENVHAYIVGEHGDSQVPVLSSAQIAGIRLVEFCRGQGLPYEVAALKAIANETRAAGREIQQAKGATYYGIGGALTRIATAILRDEDAVLTVSNVVPEWMGLGSVSLSLPSVVNRAGIARVLPIALGRFGAFAMAGGSSAAFKTHLSARETQRHRRNNSMLHKAPGTESFPAQLREW